jgi:hypothetical protein
MQPSLGELLREPKSEEVVRKHDDGMSPSAIYWRREAVRLANEHVDPIVENPPAAVFDHKACILCDHVIVQKILGNKCGQSGSLCCNLKECPIEARKRRDAEPVKQLTIESYGDGAISIAHDPFETHFNKQEVAEIRAYLNKDVIAELERRRAAPQKEIDGGSTVSAYKCGLYEAIALLRGDVK